jgi:hypothetical protein
MENKFGFYKQWYDSELDTKKSIDDSLVLPTGIISLITTALFYITIEFSFEKENLFIVISFYVFTALCAIATLVTCYFIALVYNNAGNGGWKYQSYDSPSQFLNYEEEIIKYNAKLDEFNKELDNFEKENAESELEVREKALSVQEELIKGYIYYTDENAYINVKRQNYLYLSKYIIFVSLVLMLFASSFFIINSFRKEDKEYKVKLVK